MYFYQATKRTAKDHSCLGFYVSSQCRSAQCCDKCNNVLRKNARREKLKQENLERACSSSTVRHDQMSPPSLLLKLSNSIKSRKVLNKKLRRYKEVMQRKMNTQENYLETECPKMIEYIKKMIAVLSQDGKKELRNKIIEALLPRTT